MVEPDRPRSSAGGSSPSLRSRLDCRGRRANGGQTHDPLQHQSEGATMTSYRNKYLEMLKAENSGKAPTPGAAKTDKSPLDTPFDSFDSTQDRPVSDFSPLTMPKGSPAVSARAAAGGSSGAGLSSIRTMIP